MICPYDDDNASQDPRQVGILQQQRKETLAITRTDRESGNWETGSRNEHLFKINPLNSSTNVYSQPIGLPTANATPNSNFSQNTQNSHLRHQSSIYSITNSIEEVVHDSSDFNSFPTYTNNATTPGEDPSHSHHTFFASRNEPWNLNDIAKAKDPWADALISVPDIRIDFADSPKGSVSTSWESATERRTPDFIDSSSIVSWESILSPLSTGTVSSPEFGALTPRDTCDVYRGPGHHRFLSISSQADCYSPLSPIVSQCYRAELPLTTASQASDLSVHPSTKSKGSPSLKRLDLTLPQFDIIGLWAAESLNEATRSALKSDTMTVPQLDDLNDLVQPSDSSPGSETSSCFSDYETDDESGESTEEYSNMDTYTSIICREDLTGRGASSVNTQRILSSMETELVERIMLEFWEIFNQEREAIMYV